MGSGYPLFPMGGQYCPPPLSKISPNGRLGPKLCRCYEGGLKFWINPNWSHLGSWWRHSDVIIVMTSSKSVKIRQNPEFDITFHQNIFWWWLTPHFLCFVILFKNKSISMVSRVKNMHISALFTFWDFADFATQVRQNRHNFSPDHENSAIFSRNVQTKLY